MKQIAIITLLAAITLASCGGKKTKDKNAQLATLKKELQSKKDQIAILEKELGKNFWKAWKNTTYQSFFNQ